MFWNRKEKRNNPVISSSWGKNTLPAAVFNDWTITKAVKDGLKECSWVFRSIRLIVDQAAPVPWYVYRNEKPIYEHSLSVLLNRPNPQFSRKQIFELLITWMELSGTAYLKKVKTGKGTEELWPISPDRLTPVPSNDPVKLVDGYRLDQEKTIRYQPEEIVRLILPDPANPLLGISPLQAASRAVDTDVEQQGWNKAAMQNRGVLDGVFSFKIPLDLGQFNLYREKIKEMFTGKANARTPGVIGSDASYVRTASTPAEMDFINSRKFNREEIFIAYGVPPVLAGVSDAQTYNNYATSMRIFWEGTIIPLLNDIKDMMNTSFRDELGPNDELRPDLSNVVALRADLTETVKSIKELWLAGTPMKELNERYELGLNEFTGWELPWGGSKPPSDHAQSPASSGSSSASTSKREESTYKLIERRNLRTEMSKRETLATGSVKNAFNILLTRQRDAVFTALEQDGVDIKTIVEESRGEWQTAMNTMAWKMAYHFASDIVVDKRGLPIDMEYRDDNPELNAAIQQYLEQEAFVLNEVALIEKSTTLSVLEQVQAGLEAGATVQQIKQAILDVGTFSEERALRLARTMTGTVQSIGQMAAATAAKAGEKVWVTSGFGVRDKHTQRNNETVKLDGKFSDQGGGVQPRFPLDPSLPADDRINCRCSMIFK